MICQFCQKQYPKSIPGLQYMEIWFKHYCQNCKKTTDNPTCPECAEQNNLCKTCNRDHKISQIIDEPSII